jgi:hypothetical protein
VIKRQAAKENAMLYFGDETGMCSDHQSGGSYTPKGVMPFMKSTGKRFSLNMISTIAIGGHVQFGSFSLIIIVF